MNREPEWISEPYEPESFCKVTKVSDYMITLASGTGAQDFQLLDHALDEAAEQRLLYNACRLLDAEERSDAAKFLRENEFHLLNGSNNFGDEFVVLHVLLPIASYLSVKKLSSDVEFSRGVSRVVDVLRTLGHEPRFVTCDLIQDEPPPQWRSSSGAKPVLKAIEDDRADYEVGDEIGTGGYAIVLQAKHKNSGDMVAFKRPTSWDPESAGRLKREVQEQGRIKHRHVMQILDRSKSFRWFTMPLAVGSFYSLREGLDDADLARVIDEAAQGLDAAHSLGLVHRDVTPKNILAMNESGGYRWVVADWGLVRRPLGETTKARTGMKQAFGTDGFAAPELWDDAHNNASVLTDIYSLGRVAAWAVTGRWPKPNVSLEPEGPWRQLVRSATHNDPLRRPQSMLEFRNLLASALAASGDLSKTPLDRANEIKELVRAGNMDAVRELSEIAISQPREVDVFFDILPLMPHAAVVMLVSERADDVQVIVDGIRDSFTGAAWGRRSYDHANVVLKWIENVARVAAAQGKLGLLEDASVALFEADAYWERFPQRRRTQDWILTLVGSQADTVARSLLRLPGAVKWYTKEGWTPTTAAPAIRSAIQAALAASVGKESD